MTCDDHGIHPRFVLHDRDALFIHDFDRVMEPAGVRIVKTPFRAPNANAHAERWVLSVKQECLDHLILFGLESLRRVLSCYRAFFNEHRPHQGIGQRRPIPRDLERPFTSRTARTSPIRATDVACTPFLGGLLKSYSRKAA